MKREKRKDPTLTTTKRYGTHQRLVVHLTHDSPDSINTRTNISKPTFILISKYIMTNLGWR